MAELVEEQASRLVAADTACARVDHDAQGVDVDDGGEVAQSRCRVLEATIGSDPGAQSVGGGDARADGLLPTRRDLSSREVERGEEQRRFRRRPHRPHGAIDEGLEQVGVRAMPEVDQRRLPEGATELVHRGHDEVGAEPCSVGRQVGVEAEMRAPRLVDDEDRVMCMCDGDQCGHIGAGSEVRRRHDDGGARVRSRGERSVESLGSQGVRDAEAVVDIGCDEGRLESGERQRVDDRRVHAALGDKRRAQSGDGETGDEISLARAVGQKPGAACAPGVRGECERGVERVVGTDVDSLDHSLDVELEGALAEVVGHERLGRGAALVPGDPPPDVVGLDERTQCVDIGGGVLTVTVERSPRNAHAHILARTMTPSDD